MWRVCSDSLDRRNHTLSSQDAEECTQRVSMSAWHHRFDAVIHFAGRKAVGESVAAPMLYYTHNVVGAVNLIEAMRKHNVKNVRGNLGPCPATQMLLILQPWSCGLQAFLF